MAPDHKYLNKIHFRIIQKTKLSYWKVNGFVNAMNDRIIVIVFRNVVTTEEKKVLQSLFF